jgi:hypothetical protein
MSQMLLCAMEVHIALLTLFQLANANNVFERVTLNTIETFRDILVGECWGHLN